MSPPDVPTSGAEGFEWRETPRPSSAKRRLWVGLAFVLPATVLCGWQAYTHAPTRCVSVVEVRSALQASGYVPPAGPGEAEFAVITASREVRP